MDVRLTAPRLDTENSLPNDAVPVALEDASGTAKDTVPVEPLKLLT